MHASAASKGSSTTDVRIAAYSINCSTAQVFQKDQYRFENVIEDPLWKRLFGDTVLDSGVAQYR